MLKKGTFIILLLIFVTNIKAQNTYNYSIDTITYNQYLNGKWEELFESVTKANTSGVSFYYLTLRGAFAAYYTQHYSKAVTMFRQAEQQQPLNYTAKEIHHLSAIYAGMELEQIRTYDSLPATTKPNYKNPHHKLFESVCVESGINTNNNFNNIINTKPNVNNALYAERNLHKQTLYNGIILTNSINKKLKLIQSFQYIYVSRATSFYIGNTTPDVTTPITPTNPYNPLPPPPNQPRLKAASLTTGTEAHFNTQSTQIQYFLSLKYNINDKVLITPAFTYVNYNTGTVNIDTNSTGIYYSNHFNQKGTQTYLILNIAGVFNRSIFAVNTNYLIAEYISRWQNGISAKLYPFASKRLYTEGEFYISTGSNISTTQVLKGSIGYYFNNISIEANYTTGTLSNFADNNGLYIYNTKETINTTKGVSITANIIKNKLWLSAYYKYITYNSAYTVYINSTSNNNINFEHNNHSITGGITWKF